MTPLNKYIWIVNTLHRAGESGLSLKEINEMWENDFAISDGKSICRQTFDRWKGAILDTMGVFIDCHLIGGYRYYISNPEVLSSGALSRWLLDAYSTFNALSQRTALKDRILVEEIPSSRNYLTDILDAMRENKIIELTYENFVGGCCHTFPVAPYCVKMSQKRWYMLALSITDDRLRIYGLDRIKELNVTDKTFKMPKDFDGKDYFSTAFGVVVDESTEIEKIVLRADSYHQNYLRSLPLHESQREIYTCEDYADFELYLRPTYDFCMELLRYGGMIEVLEPQSLRHLMHGSTRDLWEMYKND